MPATYTDRLNGVTTSLAVKPPCVVRTTANITLSGTQTIDGVAVVADDRVLVVAQTTASENGVYNASATAWERADDFDGVGDVVKGTLISVLGGSTLGGDLLWKITTANPITIGTTSLTIAALGLVAQGSFGTMANQNATAVNIDGGTIDGTSIGTSSASTAIFTTLTSQYIKVTSSTIPADGLYLTASNTPAIAARSLKAFDFTNPASAVNFIGTSGSATGSSVTLRSDGSDTNVNLRVQSKGTGTIFFATNTGAQIQFNINHVASAVNYINVSGAAAGSAPFLSLAGSDTNIDFKMTPKGTGLFQLGNSDSFTANNSHTVSLTALAPLGVLTSTVKTWLTIKNNSGTTLYIPAWGA